MENPQASSPTFRNYHRNRLPTLFEVLSRTTLPPVDLFSFYIFMRDYQKSVDYLDFWLDVAQHMSLCRHYVRELRRSVMISTPDGDKSQSKRSSQILEQLGDMDHPPAGPSKLQTEKEKTQDAQMSAYLREENSRQAPIGHSPSASLGSQNNSQDRPRPSFINSPHATTDSNSPQNGVARADLIRSAEHILYTYLLPQAEREIIIGHGMADEITRRIEEERRDDPEVFDEAKDWVFTAMERDAFPKFLEQKALGNILPSSKQLRLIIGLLAMFGGFWTAFIMIFLDYARLHRLYLIIPFTIGVYFLVTFAYTVDPFLALAGFSEYTFFNFVRIKEPFVRKLLIKRAISSLIVFFCITAAVLVLFIFVPGHHL